MSVPITVGAVGYEFYSGIIKPGNTQNVIANLTPVMIGILVSGISGFWAIGFLLNYLKTRDVTLFVWWRVLVAVLVFALWPFLRFGLKFSAMLMFFFSRPECCTFEAEV